MSALLARFKELSTPEKVLVSAGCVLAGGGLLYMGYRLYKRDHVFQNLSPGPKQNEGELDEQRKAMLKLKTMLRSDTVVIDDLERIEEIIDDMIVAGINSLQIVADFDRTMTPVNYNGETVPSCHRVVESCPELPDWFKEKSSSMKDHYMAIEFDPKLTREEKLPHMIEWWDKAHDLLVSTKLTRDDLVKSVNHAHLYLREGFGDLMKFLDTNSIPLLIFSAGVGDVILELLHTKYKMHDNIHIIANWMDFNDQGVMVGFKGEPIHVYNKNTHAIENADYFENISHRHNVILLGDSLGDLEIAEGIPDYQNILKIGFLNTNCEESLQQYRTQFDIVLLNDPGIDLLTELCHLIKMSQS